MSALKLQFRVITPSAVEYAGPVDSVTLTTEAGVITVLPNHVALISLLRPGEILIREGGGKERSVSLKQGVLEVFPGSRATVVGETVRAE
jgi:F-type H+-transporting ATPase subunit epsilon